MKSSTAKMVVAIYSIVFAALGLLGSFNSIPDIWTIVIALTMLVTGIILLIPALNQVEKPLIITLLVLYSLFVLAGLIVLFFIPIIALLIFGMVGVPFSFAIVFLVFKGKEESNDLSSKKSFKPIFSSNIEQPIMDTSYSQPSAEDQIYTKLTSLNRMLKEGLITQEEYYQKKKEILSL